MAPVQWCDLPAGIVDFIAKFLKSDIDNLRLRSVCSSWRSSVSPCPHKPFCFPLDVPPLSIGLHRLLGKKPYCTLYEDTLYHLSPLANGNRAGYTSNDWMLKVSGTNRNTVCLLKPLSTDKLDYPPGTIPKCLNLLDCRISEIGKFYRLDFPNQEDSDTVGEIWMIKKVIVLLDYVVDCDLAALALAQGVGIIYWKFGDENWSTIDTKGHIIEDMILCDGKCYAIDRAGVLISFDSKLQLTVVVSSPGNYKGLQNLLLECKSDLYLVSKDFSLRPQLNNALATQQKTIVDLPPSLRKFNKCSGDWDCIENLGDNVFLLGEDVSVGVSPSKA